MSERTWSSQPILDEIARRGGLDKCAVTVAATSTGRSRKTWERWYYRKVHEGSLLDEYEVDHLCVHLLGMHPFFLYGSQWWLVRQETEETVAG